MDRVKRYLRVRTERVMDWLLQERGEGRGGEGRKEQG